MIHAIRGRPVDVVENCDALRDVSDSADFLCNSARFEVEFSYSDFAAQIVD